ncbi:hypothetical protein ACFFMP_16245 [Pseudoroseomonas cervicalis]|jgi:hypothetical protein|uniref:Uncharacterized protein n=1 Tax=Pseudoroseomonas cervicalis ATCC 49957 TaxID=525371 RepID=D5RGC9_9PROT|nr:hypothetical protein HMPREF0731_0138 [Pseudoroseomonas cervicalis ATCC 49957]
MNTPAANDSAELHRALARRRSRSRALLAVLLGLAALFYAVSMARVPREDRLAPVPARQAAP